jgi:septal ring factor EnvC (AmiA/AmiB activator)
LNSSSDNDDNDDDKNSSFIDDSLKDLNELKETLLSKESKVIDKVSQMPCLSLIDIHQELQKQQLMVITNTTINIAKDQQCERLREVETELEKIKNECEQYKNQLLTNETVVNSIHQQYDQLTLRTRIVSNKVNVFIEGGGGGGGGGGVKFKSIFRTII